MQGNLKSHHLNQDSGHPDGRDAATQPEPDNTALGLPYRTRKAATATFTPVTLSIGIDPARINIDLAQLSENCHQASPEAVKQTLIITICAGLFFRYSSQPVIPLYWQPEDDQKPAGNLYLKTDPAQTFLDLAEQVAAQLLTQPEPQREPVAGADMPLAILCKSPATSPSSVTPSVKPLQADLCLVFSLESHHWSLELRYNERLFQPPIIRQLANHLEQSFYTANLHHTLAELHFLSAAEIAQLQQFGDGQRHHFTQHFPHQVIEQHAENYPHSTAVCFATDSLDYATLNLQANQLARLLLQAGADKDSRIMVLLEPRLEVPLVLLAIFKLGATYVPLEPSYPNARLQTIYEDTQALITLTQQDLRERLDGLVTDAHTVLSLEALAGQLPQFPGDNLNRSIDEHRVAYIYYTSGTTGKPKGVMASYRNLRHYIQVAHREFGYDHRDIIPCVARFTFSISMFELLSPLYAGGQLLVLPRAHILDPASMSQTLQTVTAAHIGPALLKAITHYIETENVPQARFSKLRHISSGGDMIPPELLIQLQSLFVYAEHYVIYGCSEISCMGCRWFISPEETIKQTFVGRPFNNVKVIVLDDHDNLVPPGVVGNVCFAGDGLVAGYLNRAELQAEKFFQFDGDTYYRTGDRGRWSLTGQLELLGRLDFQIKLRGMRIELAELEYHLRRCAGVKDGVIACRQTSGGEKILVAYYVVDKAIPLTKDSLRHHMAEHLPDYMVPAVYQQLSQLPLNANLKVDRNALPEISASESRSGTAASNTFESFLTSWFARELDLAEVYIEDNLFELGGDSFLAMNLITELEKQFGVNLSGMDIVRESIGVLARRLIPQSEQKKSPDKSPLAVRQIAPFKTFYFGDEQSLFGVFHPAQTQLPGTPVLICPPGANEHPRSYFFLRYLSEQLSAKGHSVLRFDYFATGNSYGQSEDASLRRWQQDQLAATAQLRQCQPGQSIIVIAARLSALLWLCLPDKPDIRHLILWDPVVNGQTHLAQQSAMHEKKIAKLFTIKGPWFRDRQTDKQQLLGFTFAKTLLDSLRTLALKAEHFSPRTPIDWVSCENLVEQQAQFQAFTEGLQDAQFVAQESPPYWYQDFLVDDGYTNPALMQQLVKLVARVSA